LAVGVAHHFHWQPVDTHGEIGTVVAIEAAQENLLGLTTARVLGDEQAWYEAQQVLAEFRGRSTWSMCEMAARL